MFAGQSIVAENIPDAGANETLADTGVAVAMVLMVLFCCCLPIMGVYLIRSILEGFAGFLGGVLGGGGAARPVRRVPPAAPPAPVNLFRLLPEGDEENRFTVLRGDVATTREKNCFVCGRPLDVGVHDHAD